MFLNGVTAYSISWTDPESYNIAMNILLIFCFKPLRSARGRVVIEQQMNLIGQS